jgi:3-oxoacyl-[acyl-carrier protein] reductase
MDRADLSGRVAVITGGAGDLGRATARHLADSGASVVLMDIVDPTPVAEQMATSAEALALVVDVTDEHQVSVAFEKALGWRGRADILVNLAGLFHGIPRVPLEEIDVDTWDRVVVSHTRTVFLCTRAVVPAMRAAGGGHIVNVSSNTAAFGMANFLHYVTGKSAVVGMTRALARELGPYGIAVNAVSPGLVHTEGNLASVPASYLTEVVAGQCLRTPIEPDDVAAAIAFLGSVDAKAITGQTISVNAGATMGAF